MSFADTRDLHTYPLLPSATLTASLNDNLRIFPSYGHDILDLEVSYTPAASSRTFTLFIEYSSDGSTFYPLTERMTDIADGHQMLIENPLTVAGTTGGTTYRRQVQVRGLLQSVRVSMKEDGSSTFGTAKVTGTFS